MQSLAVILTQRRPLRAQKDIVSWRCKGVESPVHPQWKVIVNNADDPPPRVLAQRIRNRLIEYLETASSYKEQHEYERNVPIAHVPDEIINQWEDWVDGARLDWFEEPVFSPREQEAIRTFHAVWDGVAKDTPKSLPSLSALVGTEPWERLQRAAVRALAVFAVRGKFDEERDAFAD